MCFNFGNKTGNGGWFGNSPILSMWFGNKKFYPDETVCELTLSATGTTATSSSSTVYIGVTTNCTGWTVETATDWLAVTKLSASQAQCSILANDRYEGRTGTVTFKIDDVTYATYTVEQSGAALILSANPMDVNVNYSAHSGYITVTCNTTAWTISTVSSTAFTVTRTSNTRIDWSIPENTTTAARQCYINITAGGTTITPHIYQGAGYVIDVMHESPQNVSSAATAISISVISRLDQTPIQPVVTYNYNPINAYVASVIQAGEVGQYNYLFYFDANSTNLPKSAQIVFTISGTNKSDSIIINQAAAAQYEPIPGLTSAATYDNDWTLGTALAGYITVPAGEVDSTAIVIASHSAISGNYVATVSMRYQTGPVTTAGTPSYYTVTGQTYNINSGATTTIGSNTFYGITVVAPNPRLRITEVTEFTISEAT